VPRHVSDQPAAVGEGGLWFWGRKADGGPKRHHGCQGNQDLREKAMSYYTVFRVLAPAVLLSIATGAQAQTSAPSGAANMTFLITSAGPATGPISAASKALTGIASLSRVRSEQRVSNGELTSARRVRGL
jgi:hypothetical protein